MNTKKGRSAILLAAGIGSRLGEFTVDFPKCLLPICGLPVLGHWINKLLESGFDEIYINTYYESELVESFLETEYSELPIKVIKEDQLRGTAGTLKHILEVDPPLNEAILVIHADSYTNLDISEFMRQSIVEAGVETGPIVMMMALFCSDDPASTGMVLLDSERRIVDFFEKDPAGSPGLANAAVYAMSAERIYAFLNGSDFSVDVVPQLLGRMVGYEHSGFYFDIGTLENLKEIRREHGIQKPVFKSREFSKEYFSRRGLNCFLDFMGA